MKPPIPVVILLLSGFRLMAQQDDESWNLYYQATSIGQHHGTFDSPYSGPLSFQDYAERDVSLTTTLFFGLRLGPEPATVFRSRDRRRQGIRWRRRTGQPFQRRIAASGYSDSQALYCAPVSVLRLWLRFAKRTCRKRPEPAWRRSSHGSLYHHRGTFLADGFLRQQ